MVDARPPQGYKQPASVVQFLREQLSLLICVVRPKAPFDIGGTLRRQRDLFRIQQPLPPVVLAQAGIYRGGQA
jgi:hypothetical protein